MRTHSPILRHLRRAAAAALLLLPAAAAAQQNPMTVKLLADGLPGAYGVARHPDGSVYVSQIDSGKISVIRDGRAQDALAPGWTVSEELPRWAIKEDVPLSAWMKASLDRPGPLAISTNGTLYVAEQVPNGRILSFTPDENGAYTTATCIPVPWLEQQFQWHDILVDTYDRLYIAGMDEIGPEFMKFGSSLVRDQEGDWWVMDFGPFSRFSTMALSARQDALLLGDKGHGNISWWEVNRHIMMGGSAEVAGRSTLQSLAFYPDGSFVIGQIDSPTSASVVRMDPFSGQQVNLVLNLKSVGDIEMDRVKGCLYITDPADGRVIEATPNPPMAYNEVAIRQIVRSIEGMSGVASEAPAFLNNFFDRLQDAAKDLLPDEDATHSVQFTLSDIAGKMPIVAGRVQTVVATEGAEKDPIDTLEFFLLFPSKIVMTEDSATPSLSFFSLKRKSGAIEQTKPVFKNEVGVYRMSGTNIFKIGTSGGGLYVPVVTCGLKSTDDGIAIDLAFLGSGVYGDYYLSLFQGPLEQSATLVVQADPADETSETVTYEASFMEEAVIEGLKGQTREKMSNLLVSGFSGGGAGANRSVGWLRLGKFPAQATVSYGDAENVSVALAGAGDLKDVLEKKELELRQASAEELAATGTEPVGETVSQDLISAAAAAQQAAAAGQTGDAPEEDAAAEPAEPAEETAP